MINTDKHLMTSCS